MLKVAAILFCILALSFQKTSACTIFESPFQGDTRFAHNVDWYEQFPDVKGVLVMNPARLKKAGMILGVPVKPAEWVSKWRSLSFSIAGAEIPVDGFNEKGLVMGVLELAESAYPPVADARPGLGAGQFVQYNLDTSENLEQVVASLKDLRVVSSVRMHFWVCDASAKCAVIQYIDGDAKVYRDSTLPFPVLTNSLYPQSVAAANACLADATECSPSDTSLARFATAAKMRTEMSPSRSFDDQAADILERVKQNKGTLTRFQLIYDPLNRVVKARKRGNTEYGELKVHFENADCRKPRMVLPVDENSVGDLSNNWIELTEAFQVDMVTKMGYPPAAIAAYGHYPFTVICQ